MSLPASIQAWMPAAQRVMARCAELAAVSSHPDHIDRAYLTDQHKQVNALAGQWRSRQVCKRKQTQQVTWLGCVTPTDLCW